jgi:SH3-like domain-containing protein
VKLALGDWAKVELPGGATGWMPRSTLTLHEDYPTGVHQVIVSVNKAALRQTPSHRARKADVLRQGASAEVQEKLGNWYRVRSPQGSMGWMSEDEVKPAEGSVTPSPQTKA